MLELKLSKKEGWITNLEEAEMDVLSKFKIDEFEDEY